ncbi:glycosyltransferase family 2 protein [Paenibacillus beijingensis]|uniref:glycosyltransferase family 2 protein n=1 Tax=Paenibacillus beijingensis TaxID=1126833 RepID=UPI000AF6ED80|nr:glycosyltransferase family 2 protein [Paenibacillus beijingensis]
MKHARKRKFKRADAQMQRGSSQRRTARSQTEYTEHTFEPETGQPPLVSVIIPVMNERKTLARVLRQAEQIHPRYEIIVVANGSTDGSVQIARQKRVRLIEYPYPLGHDVGRSVGAKAARGEVLLFIDGDMVIPAGKLRPFVKAIMERDADVALNNYSGPTGKKKVHNVVLAKHALNELLGRHDLEGTSLTAVPHALSRQAIQVLGSAVLSVPPLAHAKAVRLGLKVATVNKVNVGKINPLRRRRERVTPLEHLIIGDHLEAIGWMIEHDDGKAQWPDDEQFERAQPAEKSGVGERAIHWAPVLEALNMMTGWKSGI